MDKIKPIQKRITEKNFSPTELVKDRVGNVFIKRTAVAKLFETSLVSLSTTFKQRGLRPLDRYVKGYKVYLLEDVEAYYNRRESA
ncbi:MAG: hypothetical protein IKL48_00040 [Elusimicrobiaceae bacterium]|nr:hypothetical protein [Elusimicrobiaceae bacterium]